MRPRAPKSIWADWLGPRLIGITGTPGTGKKSIAPVVAEQLKIGCYGLNDLALAEGLAGRGEHSSEVDTAALRRLVSRTVSGPAVLYGHLLPYAVPRPRIRRAIVLRCEPATLRRRLMARGYPHAKVVQNVEAELIGLVSADSFRTYGVKITSELDTTRLRPIQAARSVLRMLKSPARPEAIDWTPGYDSGPRLRELVSE